MTLVFVERLGGQQVIGVGGMWIATFKQSMMMMMMIMMLMMKMMIGTF